MRAHGLWGVSLIFLTHPRHVVFGTGLHVPRNHRLPAFRHLNMLDHYGLLPSGRILCSVRRASWYICIMRAAAFVSRALSPGART